MFGEARLKIDSQRFVLEQQLLTWSRAESKETAGRFVVGVELRTGTIGTQKIGRTPYESIILIEGVNTHKLGTSTYLCGKSLAGG